MPADTITVKTLTLAPVKGLRLSDTARVQLDRGGVRGDRRMYLVDDGGKMFNGKRSGALNEVCADLDEAERHLTLRFPDGRVVAGALEHGETVSTMFFSNVRRAIAMRGPFSAALSEHVGESLRLVAAADGSSAVDRGEQGAVSMMSTASLAALADSAGEDTFDARRFRMSIQIDGVGAFEEDSWIGRELSVGEASIRVWGHVGRCLVTSRHPDSGAIDVPMLDHLRALRADAFTSEPLAFGVHAEVLVAGVVRVGDAVGLV